MDEEDRKLLRDLRLAVPGIVEAAKRIEGYQQDLLNPNSPINLKFTQLSAAYHTLSTNYDLLRQEYQAVRKDNAALNERLALAEEKIEKVIESIGDPKLIDSIKVAKVG